MPFCCFEAFLGKFTENFSFLSKKWLSLKRTLKYSESLFFLPCLKRTNPDKNGVCLNNFFWSNQLKVINVNKNCFPQIVSHIVLNYAFLLFWRIFGEIHSELLFLDIKVNISQMSTEILRKFVFLTIFEKGLILRKIWNCLSNFFWSNQ